MSGTTWVDGEITAAEITHCHKWGLDEMLTIRRTTRM